MPLILTLWYVKYSEVSPDVSLSLANSVEPFSIFWTVNGLSSWKFMQSRSVAIEDHYVSFLGGKTVVDRNFSAACFVDHGDFHAVAETARNLHRKNIYVFYHRIFFDHVICDVAFDPADIDVVADCTVVNRCVTDTGRPGDSAEKRHLLIKTTKFHMSGKMCLLYSISSETRSYCDLRPFTATASLIGQLSDLIFR